MHLSKFTESEFAFITVDTDDFEFDSDCRNHLHPSTPEDLHHTYRVWIREFIEREGVSMSQFISSCIVSELYYSLNERGLFWERKSFIRDYNSMPFIFMALKKFFYWLLNYASKFDFSMDFNHRMRLYLSESRDSKNLIKILNEKMENDVFYNKIIVLINFFDRNGLSFEKWKQSKKDKLKNNKDLFNDTDIRSAIETIAYEKARKEIETMNQLISRNLELKSELESKLLSLDEKISTIDEIILKKAQEIVDSKLPLEVNKIKEENQKDLFNKIFNQDISNLSKSDVFEKEEAERERRKRLEEVERREFKSEIREQINEHGKTIYEAKSEFKDYTSAHSVEHANEKADYRIAFERLDAKIEKVKIETDIRFVKVESESEKRYVQLESGMQVLKSYVENFDITINARIDREISTVGHTIADLKINIKESFMSVDKEFGVRDVRFKEEILKLNENQMKIVGYLETLKNQTENFKQQVQNEMSRALIEIDRKGLTFEQVRATASQLLEKTEILYRGIQVENGGLKNKLEASLGELELGKKSMFVELSKQKLVLEKATQDVYHTAKEVAYGKLDIELLHSEKQQRLNESQSQLNGTLQEIRMKEQEMKSFWANESTRNRLENQIALLHERSQYEKSHLERRAEEAEFVVRRLRDKNLAY